METEPYEWAFVERRFSTENAAALASSFSSDMLKKVKRYEDEKGCENMSRSLIHMGALIPSSPEGLSPAWRSVAEELLSAEYRSRWMARPASKQIASARFSSSPLETPAVP